MEDNLDLAAMVDSQSSVFSCICKTVTFLLVLVLSNLQEEQYGATCGTSFNVGSYLPQACVDKDARYSTVL